MIEKNKDYPRMFSNEVPDTWTWTCPVEKTPSDLELRIRREVHVNIETLMDELYKNGLYNREYHIELLTKVRDRLNLLWGSNE